MINLKTKLKERQITIGSWITLAHPAIAEIMAKAGFDWLSVDLEHSVITIRETEELIRVIDLCGVVPLIRLAVSAVRYPPDGRRAVGLGWPGRRVMKE